MASSLPAGVSVSGVERVDAAGLWAAEPAAEGAAAVGLVTDAYGLHQRETPFFDAVRAYRDLAIVPFHTPGHKQGRGAPGDWADAVSPGALGMDVSDVLHAPRWDDSWTGVLAAAEGLAAHALGADYCHFLVNGTTAGVHAMLLAAAPGGKVIVARNSHRSVIGGLILADAWPVYVEPGYDPATGLWLPPPLASWIRALEEHPDARAVLVTYPTYDGAALDIKALVDAAQTRGTVVLVDEAHGPHFGLHPSLPPRAITQGADLSAQSPHKLLGALTQASWLLGRHGLLSPDAVATVLGILQSTSPSALLLASLDVARRQVALDGHGMVEAALARARMVRERVARLPGLACLEPDAGLRWDPTRLLIQVSGLGISGYTAARLLRQWGVQVELAGPGYVLALITWSDDDATIAALCRALERLVDEGPAAAASSVSPALALPPSSPSPPLAPAEAPPPPPGPQKLRPRSAALARAELVPLEAAEGAVAADIVCPYPPGIPVLCPGEQVLGEAVAYLQDILEQGGEVRGLAWVHGRPHVRAAQPGGR